MVARTRPPARLEGDVAVLPHGNRYVVASRPSEVISAWGEEGLAALEDLRSGWWAGWLAYELGGAVEPSAYAHRSAPPQEPPVPHVCLARFEERSTALPSDLGAAPVWPRSQSPPLRWESSLDPVSWRRAVEKILEHLEAGDCYQVNLTRRLEAEAAVDPLRLFAAVLGANPAPYAALVRLGGIAAVSASPERFLRRDRQAIETRPVKGTGSDPDRLRASPKDHAENVMIVDLARNDLGRVCRYGSVEVPSLCAVEAHPGLFHLVSTVRGHLRDAITPGEIIRAAFPPASVTGCPKPRVLQIISDLEPVPRGIYCGAIGFIDADNDIMDLSVAIRTFTITPDRIYFGVGGGIVADSDPDDEWRETELKARRLLALAESSDL